MDLRPIPGGHQPRYYANQSALLRLSLFVYDKKGNQGGGGGGKLLPIHSLK